MTRLSAGARLVSASFYLMWALVVITVGLILRLVPLGLPAPVVKWGGSVLWAMMVYLLLAACLYRSTRLTVAMIASAIAAVVELSRLYHQPSIDAFRLARVGILLLGRVFSWWHFVVYWVAIAIFAAGDHAFTRRLNGVRAGHKVR